MRIRFFRFPAPARVSDARFEFRWEDQINPRKIFREHGGDLELDPEAGMRQSSKEFAGQPVLSGDRG